MKRVTERVIRCPDCNTPLFGGRGVLDDGAETWVQCISCFNVWSSSGRKEGMY